MRPLDLRSVRILGLPVHDLTMETALERLNSFVREGSAHHVVTADASMLVMAQEDRDLHEIICAADLVTPDSAGILWAAKRLSTPLTERVSGVDIVERLCAESGRTGLRIYFFGAAPGVAARAEQRIRSKYPGANIVGTRDGYFEPDETDAIVDSIRSAKPDVLCVALGIPKQEKWIAAHRNSLGVPILIGVGGTFDVLSGRVRRAPVWMRRLQIEWVWRLLSNPRKIAKVKLLPRFWWMVRVGGKPAASSS